MEGAPRSLHLAKVEEKDVSSHTRLVTRMQPKPAKSRQESGARTPSEGKSATDSEELYGDECGNEPPIRRKISHPSNTSPHSGGENSVKARKVRNRIRDATASAINEGNVKKKLKIPQAGIRRRRAQARLPKKGLVNQYNARHSDATEESTSEPLKVSRKPRKGQILRNGFKRQTKKGTPSKRKKPSTGRRCHLERK